MDSILSEIRGSMTGFEKLTPELVEKLSCDGLTYDELKEAMQKSGLSIDKVVCDPSRVFQNAFFADYENGKYCEIYLQKSYINQLMQVSTLNFSYSGKNPILISQDWQRFYQQSVPLPMAIYDFSRRYLDIPKNKVFSVWFFIHKRLDYSYGLWNSELLEYVYTYAPEFEPPQTDSNGYVTVYRGIGNDSLPTEKAISWSSNHMNALWFANHSARGIAVLVGKIKPENIVYYEPGYSNENEVLVRPGSVEQIHAENFLPATEEIAVPLITPLFTEFATFAMAAKKLGYPSESVFEYHGIKHILRVLTLTLIYCKHSGDDLSDEDKQILIHFSLLHDYGRDNEGVDDEHGNKSVEKINRNRIKIRGINLSKKGRLIADYLIRYHCKADEIGETAINAEAKFSRKDKERAVHLYRIAKDMDGLDRVRFCGLDYKMLRTDYGRQLPLIAGALLKEQLINLLATHSLEECLQLIIEKEN